MDKELMEYLNALQVGVDNLERTKKAMAYLHSKSVDFLSENRECVANLFYQILCSFQRLYGDKTEERVGQETLVLFEHIAHINTNLETQSSDSNLMTIWFLNELYQKARIGKETIIDEDRLKNDIEKLMVGLSDVRYIFRITKDGEKVFPINRLISKVIKDDKFIGMSCITPYHIKMFQLAVELFGEEDDVEILKMLKDECNLKFLEYLDGTHKIIDTADFLNYQKNGVMIFYSSNKNAILIRHEKRSYFSISGTDGENDVEEELNSQKDVIGYYVIIDNIKDIELVDFSDLMLSSPLKILDLIYEQGCYNIFHEMSLYKKGNEIYPVNKYAVNDKFIIKGFMDRPGHWYTKDRLNEVIRKYRMMGIVRKEINQVSFGLCQCLLEENNTGIDALRLEEYSSEDWLQNHVLQNWVGASGNKKSALMYVLQKYCNELGYCKNDLSRYNIVTQDLLPYSCNFKWIYEILNIPQDNYSIYMGTVSIDDAGRPFLYINNTKTMAGKMCKKDPILYLEQLEFYACLSNDDKEDYAEEGIEHYVIYDDVRRIWGGVVADEELYRYLAHMELLLYRNSLPFQICTVINANQVNDIKTYIELHQDALMSVGDEHKLFADFDSMVIYRLVHNLIWSKITEDNWEIFYKVLNHHQKLRFKDIARDAVFQRQEVNTLYVPKDNTGSDGTLCRTYFEYMIERMRRDRTNPYYPSITFDKVNNRYMVNGNLINKITFLFDNTCSGTGTCNALAFYLNREELVTDGWSETKKEKMRNSQQKYQVNDKLLSVYEIIQANSPLEVEVYSYYGTDIGVTKVKELLKECGYENIKVNYANKITQYYMPIADDVKKIWETQSKENTDFCTFIREFNQPKKNVFPIEMLEDAKKAICLFVLKKE